MPVPGFDVPNNYYEPDDEEPMIRSANLCDKCDTPTANAENDYGEFICDDCEQNAAERGWERFCEDFHGGADPLTIREKQIAAWRLK